MAAGKPGAPGADDDDIGLVVPLDGVGRGHLRQGRSRRREDGRRTDAGGSSRLDEIAPADGLLALMLSIFSNAVPLLGHMFTSLQAAILDPYPRR